MLHLKLAWRNIWRNKRRTLITIFSIFVAVVLSALSNSMQIGSYDQMIENVAGLYLGYAQVHQDGYWDDPQLNNSFGDSDSLQQKIASVDEVTHVVPRIESYALAAGREQSRASLVIGMHPEKEKVLVDPQQKLVKGDYFESPSQRAALVSEGLADYLNLSVGDTLVILGQGFRGMSAADKYPITGILDMGMPQMNKNTVYIPLHTAQELFGAYDRLTAYALMVEDARSVEEVVTTVRSRLSDDYEVMSWQTLMPELVQAIEADWASGMIMLLVLYMVVGFGIFGTILMMVAERQYELGVMMAIGTHKATLQIMMVLELLMISIIGVIGGAIGSLPFIWYFHLNPIRLSGTAAEAVEQFGIEPIVPFSTDPQVLFIQAAIIFGIAVIISLYPVVHIQRLQPVKAMQK